MILGINNNQKIMYYLNDSKKKTSQLLKEELFKEDTAKMFANMINTIQEEINYLMNKLVRVIFVRMEKELYVELFKYINKRIVG